MKTIRSIRFLLISLIIMLVVAPFSSVAAEEVVPNLVPPIPPNALKVHCGTSDNGTVCHWTAPFGTPSSGVPYGTVTCDGSPVIVNLQGEMKVNAFYNESGQGTLLKRHISFSGTLSSPVTGKAVPHEGHATITIDFLTNTMTTTGLLHHTVLPGEGVVFLDAGIIAITDGAISFVGGPHEFYLQETQGLCAALS